ncbi:hypothetical protein H5395_16550 [Paracoccus sp. MC1854]|uniref:hypothetical protein n=1 Tax=Paracoccus sp. MC1854 TaxID=2760306 RepID=UPI0016002075|nr:hypothetical protein [Paracoccus sp. MC1854]MBB1493085.1 hypothetical protein [Paracoccus sp. MC1854]
MVEEGLGGPGAGVAALPAVLSVGAADADAADEMDPDRIDLSATAKRRSYDVADPGRWLQHGRSVSNVPPVRQRVHSNSESRTEGRNAGGTKARPDIGRHTSFQLNCEH